MRCLWVSLPRALLAVLLLVSAGAGATSALDWQIETVDASEGSAAELLSLALDAGGTPHIGYQQRRAEARGPERLGLGIRTVDPVYPSGLSLALDPAGAPRIAYRDSADMDLRVRRVRRLRLAGRDGGLGWIGGGLPVPCAGL